MDQMTDWLNERVAELRAEATPVDEGSLWVLMFSDPHGAPVLMVAISETMNNTDDVTVDNLAMIIDRVGATAVVLGIPRASGHPTDSDRRFWRDIQSVVPTSTELLDLVVVGPSDFWSARRTLG